jgi:phosphoserine phosphatase RsbU/P
MGENNMPYTSKSEQLFSTINHIIVENNHDEYTLNYLKVLRGITDVIGVYTPDNTIMFYNEAGYNFYSKTPAEAVGKKCYEMLGRKSKCTTCCSEKAIKTREIVRVDKYIPELDKYVDCCCNPVLDNNGEVILVVEQLRDITEKKIADNLLKKKGKDFRKIVDNSPEAILIITDGIAVFANNNFSKLYGADLDEIIGKSIINAITPNYQAAFIKRYQQILNKEIKHTLFDYEILRYDNTVIAIEVNSKFLKYNGKPSVQSVIRNITQMKSDLKKAADFQKLSLQKKFPLEDLVSVDSIFVASKTVSGDFYHLIKGKDNLIIGILGDVNGKGITAALNVSALNVLFHEAVLNYEEPLQIIKSLNLKVSDYLNENYIAACCFSIDFKNNIVKVVSAGISQFIYVNKDNGITLKTIPGTFLGMFDDSIFDEEIISFSSGDKFYFYSDGLDFIFDDVAARNKFIRIDLIKNLETELKDRVSDANGLKDDSTLLRIEIK